MVLRERVEALSRELPFAATETHRAMMGHVP
jgi:hypothetical protein